MFLCRKCQDTISDADRRFWLGMAAKMSNSGNWLDCPVCYEATVLGRVVRIVSLKEMLPLSCKGLLDVGGARAQCVEMTEHGRTPEGALIRRNVYEAGDRYDSKLRFWVKLVTDEVAVELYQPGDWEAGIDLAYDEVKRVLQIADKAEEASKKHDNGLWQKALRELGSFPIGQGLIANYNEGLEKAQKGKLRCEVCQSKIDPSSFGSPFRVPFCPRCGKCLW